MKANTVIYFQLKPTAFKSTTDTPVPDWNNGINKIGSIIKTMKAIADRTMLCHTFK
jgi:hypothetical protein